MTSRPVVLLLPGQGLQHSGLAGHLWDDPHFADAAEEMLVALGDTGRRLRSEWNGSPPTDDQRDQGRYAQPLLFLVGYAVGRALRRHGVTPSAMIGHSVGELAAATLAGVLDVPAAGRVLQGRCDSLRLAPDGGMVGVAGRPERVHQHLRELGDPDVVVAAHNSPHQTIVAGPEDGLLRAQLHLTANGLITRRVRASEPWHSPAMALAAEVFTGFLTSETLHAADHTVVSTRTARPVTTVEARSPGFWATQMASPVLFWPALDRVLRGDPVTVVDAGPGNGLGTLARSHAAVRSGRSEVVSLLPAAGRGGGWDQWRSALQQITAAVP
jgi:[acyl-carrier-protein] S-malonyltransferase